MDHEEKARNSSDKFKPHIGGDGPSNSFKSYYEKKNKGRN